MGKEHVVLTCPFCKEGKIEGIHFTSVKKYVSGPYGGGKNKVIQSEDSLHVTTDCPKCGAKAEKIRSEFNKERQVSHEERLKRLRDSGLPTVIES